MWEFEVWENTLESTRMHTAIHESNNMKRPVGKARRRWGFICVKRGKNSGLLRKSNETSGFHTRQEIIFTIWETMNFWKTAPLHGITMSLVSQMLKYRPDVVSITHLRPHQGSPSPLIIWPLSAVRLSLQRPGANPTVQFIWDFESQNGQDFFVPQYPNWLRVQRPECEADNWLSFPSKVKKVGLFTRYIYNVKVNFTLYS
jgi:hypothetical protein